MSTQTLLRDFERYRFRSETNDFANLLSERTTTYSCCHKERERSGQSVLECRAHFVSALVCMHVSSRCIFQQKDENTCFLLICHGNIYNIDQKERRFLQYSTRVSSVPITISNNSFNEQRVSWAALRASLFLISTVL